jgi:hypothetical protein
VEEAPGSRGTLIIIMPDAHRDSINPLVEEAEEAAGGSAQGAQHQMLVVKEAAGKMVSQLLVAVEVATVAPVHTVVAVVDHLVRVVPLLQAEDT